MNFHTSRHSESRALLPPLSRHPDTASRPGKGLLTTRPRGSLGSLAVQETLRVVYRGTLLYRGLRVTGFWMGNGAAERFPT